jgi:hypothetical protein
MTFFRVDHDGQNWDPPPDLTCSQTHLGDLTKKMLLSLSVRVRQNALGDYAGMVGDVGRDERTE